MNAYYKNLVQRLKEEQMNHFLVIETMQRASERINELEIENKRLCDFVEWLKVH